jgi:hypothetical protein
MRNREDQSNAKLKRKTSIVLGIVICIATIGISYVWMMALMDSVISYRSPLHDSPPVPNEALGTSNTRSVVIILVDALRYDTSLKSDVMPFYNQLRSAGASALMHSRPPSYSQPAYTTLLTGAWSDINDGPIITVDYADIPTFTQDNIFSAAYRAGLMTAISGFNWFEKMIPQQAIAASFYTAGEDQAADREVTDAALPWLREGIYGLVLIHLDQVDYAGHYEGGPLDPRWDAAATRVDGLIAEIASAMDLTKDTLLVVSDHGHIDQGGHGGQDPITLREPFVLVGNKVVPGQYNDVQMVDVAPTVAIALGTNIPATSQGSPQYEMFDFSLAQIDHIKQVVTAQQARLAQVYQDAIGQPVTISQASNVVTATQTGMDAARGTRLNSQRILQGVIAVLLLFLIINMAAWHARPHFMWILIGVVCYLVVFNIKYLLIDHKTYSLSSVADVSSLISSSLMTTAIALFVGWFLVLLGTKAYWYRPRQAADSTLKFVLVTLSILSIPIFVHVALNGFLVTWTLPDFFTSFLGLIFLMQTLMVATFGLFLTGISALIGVFAHPRSR